MPDLTADDVAGREFRSGFRGYAISEVRDFLAEVAGGLAGVIEERDRMVERMAFSSVHDLKAEIAEASREVGEVLEAARQAAEAMRSRAEADATEWRSQAAAVAHEERTQAAIDSEALRSDAWTMSEQLLAQCQVEAALIVETSEKEALRLVGEAEREAHRIQAAGRREAEDAVRAARMEAEQMAAEARARHDEVIESAQSQSEAAQERTLALEQRREELLRELETVRATLTLVEGEVDLRREHPEPPPSPPEAAKVVKPSERVVSPPPDESKKTWVPGETVRVVHQAAPRPTSDVTIQRLEPEVKILTPAQFARIRSGLDPDEPSADVESDVGTPKEDPGIPEPDPDDLPKVTLPPKWSQTEEGGEPIPEVAQGPEIEAVGVAEGEQEVELASPPVDLGPPDGADDVVQAVELAARTEPHPGDDTSPEPVEPKSQPITQPSADATLTEPVAEPAEREPIRLQSAPRVVSAPLVIDHGEPGGGSQPTLFNEMAGLFDRLRTDEVPAVAPPGDGRKLDAEEPVMSRRLTTAVVDPFEVRDRMLLPIGNRALRNLKRQLTEAQNVALEEVRLDETAWQPTVDWILQRVRADLVVLFAESFGAGHSAAEEMMGGRVPRPSTPRDEVADEFSENLVGELLATLAEGRASGHGARQLGASISRAFRGWRTDQSERRVRELSLVAYHRGLTSSLELADVSDLTWHVLGRGCATCRAASEERPLDLLPPAHAGCECTVAP